jgi:hypothetical protein
MDDLHRAREVEYRIEVPKIKPNEAPRLLVFLFLILYILQLLFHGFL